MKVQKQFLLLAPPGILLLLGLAFFPKRSNEITGAVEARYLKLMSGDSRKGLRAGTVHFERVLLKALECKGELTPSSDGDFLPVDSARDLISVSCPGSFAGKCEIALDRYVSEEFQPRLEFDAKSDSELSITPDNGAFGFQFVLSGTLRLRIDSLDRTVSLQRPVGFAVSGLGFQPPMNLTLRDSQVTLLEMLPVSGMEFYRFQKNTVEPTRSPGINAGSIHLESYEGQTFDLRRNEMLRFRTFNGELSGLAFRKGALYADFFGEAVYPQIGSSNYPRDLSPSILQSLLADKKFFLAGSGIIYILGLLWTVTSHLFPTQRKKRAWGK